jgi:hypothetical protein
MSTPALTSPLALKLYIAPMSLLNSLALWGFVIWSWFFWFKSVDHVFPRWRALATGAGLFFATVATALDGFLYVHAIFTGGYSILDPIEWALVDSGTLAAWLGLAAGIAGKGRPRIPVIIFSVLNLFFNFLDVLSK